VDAEPATDGVDGRIERLVANALGDSVSAHVLGGWTREERDYLWNDPLAEYLAEGEQPHHVFATGFHGLTVETLETTHEIQSEPKMGAVAAVTDRRIVMIVAERAAEEWATVQESDLEVSIPYDAIESFELDSWRLRHYRLTVHTEREQCSMPVSGGMGNAGVDDEIESARQYIRTRMGNSGDSPDGWTLDVALAGTHRDSMDGDRLAEERERERGEPPLATGRGATQPTVEVYPDEVLLLSGDGTKTIPVESITGVERKDAALGEKGYLYFDQQGHDRSEFSVNRGGYIYEPPKSASTNGTAFDLPGEERAREIQQAVEGLIRGDEVGGSDGGRDGADAEDADADGTSGEPSHSDASTAGSDDASVTADDPVATGSDQPDEAIQLLREQFARGELSKEEYETRLDVLQDTS
jgi:hypothetical protein